MRVHRSRRSSISPSSSSFTRSLSPFCHSLLFSLVLLQIPLPRPCLGATVNAPGSVLTSIPSLAVAAAINTSNLTLAFPDIAARVPACGLSCVIGLAPNRSCLEQQGHGPLAHECLCGGDDRTYYPTVLACVQRYCTVEDSVGWSIPISSSGITTVSD